ncbi:MAG: ureidoglycolate lyase [Hyphomicrobiaceae bacterium]|nr:ureidoglycolate lyase [Hyphomicrobiaceae bacterium]MCC0023352.1 ureidoglycolate lyase [Hyphomicrobiaceae bacterium]
MPRITAQPLTRKAFEPYGDVIEIREDDRHFPINDGTTERFDDLATAIALGEEARVAISMARAQPFQLPHFVHMVERHPEGSQAFIPVVPARFLVIVSPDQRGKPGNPEAFLAGPGQGINFFAGTWHGVLTTLDRQTDFIIVDRKGVGENLKTFTFDEPWEVDID